VDKIRQQIWRTIAICVVAVLLSGTSLVAQVNWTVYGKVLSRGDPGDLDENYVTFPCVIYDDEYGCYRMWYAGESDKGRIFLAQSPDGITWTKYIEEPDPYPTPVLRPGSSGEWDAESVTEPWVLKRGPGDYLMWYGSCYDTYHIGFATSPDGIHWTKYDDPDTPNAPYAESDPVLRGNPWIAIGPHVLYEDDIYKMWFTSERGFTSEEIFYAQSWDGFEWWRDPFAVLPRGDSGAWDRLTWAGAVLPNETGYHMWYPGSYSWGNRGGIGYAVSGDERGWRKYHKNPLADLPQDADMTSVLKEGLTYKMWFAKDGPNWNIYYATAPQEPVTVTSDWFQEDVPIGGKLEFSAVYTNHTGSPYLVEVSYYALKDGNIIKHIATDRISFPVGNTTRVYSLTVPNQGSLVCKTYTIGCCVIDIHGTDNEFWDTFDFHITEAAGSPPMVGQSDWMLVYED
jgi:hypothetical protein